MSFSFGRISKNVLQINRGMRTTSLFSLPVNLGQPFLGPDKAPSLLIENGLLQELASLEWRVLSVPEISSNSSILAATDSAVNAKNCAEIGKITQQIMIQVSEHAATGNFLLILGGDHCIPIGTIPAILKHRPSTGVVWVDAHADINVPATSNSGNMHGMPLGFLLGLVDKVQELPSMNWFKPPYLSPKDIIYIGLRDLDRAEKRAIKSLGIKAYTMYDVDKLGIGRVMDECTDYFRHYNGIHLSYDIDAVDPFFAPSTGTAVRGGLTFREANYICESLYATKKLTSMELVEVNPSLHSSMDSKKTIEMAMMLIKSAMGESIL